MPQAAPWRKSAARLTFSPRSSLVQLDLRNGTVRSLPTGPFFSVDRPSVSRSGRLAFIASRCASCPQQLAILQGDRPSTVAPAISAAWLNETEFLVSGGRGEETEISLVGLDGSVHDLEWLSEAAEAHGVESEQELVVSPNGRTLLFSGEGSDEHHGNYIADLSSRRLLPLSGDADDAPTFSRDARRIAYQHVSASGDWDVCLSRISLESASGRRCFNSPVGHDRGPSFLPNGNELVFSSDRGSPRSGISSLYQLDLASGSVRRLTPAGYDATSPVVAPGGHSVIFVRRSLVPLP